MAIKHIAFTFSILCILFSLTYCSNPEAEVNNEFSNISQVKSGEPAGIMLTAYSTTLIANGKDKTRLRIAYTDSLGREITSVNDTVRIYVKGSGQVLNQDGSHPKTFEDTSGSEYVNGTIKNGICWMQYLPGNKPDKVKLEVVANDLWPAAHEVHIIPGNTNLLKPAEYQLPKTTKPIDRMIGADISWLPELEDIGTKFYENGQEVGGLKLLKSHGFNYIRLRLFVNPENEKGYSPQKGYCNLEQTLAMAKRIKQENMKFLLDFHYSDYWADPQQQYKPKAWQNLSFEQLKDTVESYTKKTLEIFNDSHLMPDMVQIGNEINHGILWPDGHISQLDKLAELLKAGVNGAQAVDADLPIMMHIALGGQNKEARFWLNNMIARDVTFDIIGISYYPRWHGTLSDLKYNLNDLTQRYHKPINVVEYSNYKKTVHDICFNLPNNMGKGACIWEPLNWHTNLVKNGGQITDVINVYNELNNKYLK